MASQVPYDPVPSVRPELAPTPYGHVTPPPGAFGGLTAAATEALGRAVSQTGSELFERANAMQLLSEQAAADSATSDFQMKQAQAHGEFLSLQGRAAADGLNPMLQRVEDIRTQIASGLSSPYAVMQFNRDTRRMQGNMMTSAAGHAATQQKAYVTGSLQARSDAANNEALSFPQNDAAFQASLAEKDRLADQSAAQGGWSQEQRDNWATHEKSQLSLARLTGIAKTDPFLADRLAAKDIADKVLVGQDIATATSRIYTQQNTLGAKKIANQKLSGEGSAAGAGPIPLDVAATSVGQYMSKDNYDLVGRAHDGSGQALGRYGVPAEKLSAWLKEADMPDMSAGDFLKSHQAQDQLFSTRFGKLQDDSGNFNDAVLKWTGRETTPITQGKASNVGTAEQKQAFSFFTSRGWSEDMAHAMVATLSGESGSHLDPMANQKAGGRNWESRFEHSDPSNGIANWDNTRSSAFESFARAQGLSPNDRMAQLKFVDYEARQMGINPSERGDPRALTIRLTGSADSGQGYEKPLVNNGASRWAKYSGQRYSNDPVIQQTNGLVARNTPLESLIEQGKADAADLAPNNPLFSTYLTDRITSEYHHQEALQKAEEFQNKQIVDAALMPDEQGNLPTTLDDLRHDPKVAAAYDHGGPENQMRWNKALLNNLVAGGVQFTDQTFRQYNSLKTAAINPGATAQERQALLDEDIPGLSIPMKARNELFELQRQVYKQEESSPQMGRALRVLGPMLNAIGLDKTDKDNYESFISQLHDAIQEHNRDFAKPLGDDDIKDIGTRLLRDQPQSWLGSWFTSPTKWYQLPVPSEYSDKVRADPRWERVGVEPTDDMIHTMWVQQQFQQLYGKQRKTGLTQVSQ